MKEIHRMILKITSEVILNEFRLSKRQRRNVIIWVLQFNIGMQTSKTKKSIRNKCT